MNEVVRISVKFKQKMLDNNFFYKTMFRIICVVSLKKARIKTIGSGIKKFKHIIKIKYAMKRSTLIYTNSYKMSTIVMPHKTCRVNICPFFN